MRTYEEGIKKQNYMTAPVAIKELEKIDFFRQSDGIYRLDHAATATQKAILSALEITPSTIPHKANVISDSIASVDEKAV